MSVSKKHDKNKRIDRANGGKGKNGSKANPSYPKRHSI